MGQCAEAVASFVAGGERAAGIAIQPGSPALASEVAQSIASESFRSPASEVAGTFARGTLNRATTSLRWAGRLFGVGVNPRSATPLAARIGLSDPVLNCKPRPTPALFR